MFAPPSLVASLLQISPQLQSLPKATRNRIADAGDISGAGRVRVVGAPSGLNVRQSGSTDAAKTGLVPNGATGSADGTIDNGFAYVEWDGGLNGWSAIQYLAPEGESSSSSAASAPAAAELPAGTYVVKVDDGLNVRSTPQIVDGNAVGGLAPGTVVQTTGKNQNDFAQITASNLQLIGGQVYNGTAWVAAHYLVSQGNVVQGGSGELVLSSADLLQLRAMLAAWANATPNAPAYGSAADMALDANAMVRQGNELAAFQKWANANMGKSLRTDGVVDQATRDALVEWSQRAVQTAVGNDPANPQLPPVTPVVSTGNDVPITPEEGGGAMIALVAAGAAVFFVLEQRKKKRAGVAA